MLRFVGFVGHLGVLPRLANFMLTCALLCGWTFAHALAQTAGVQPASSPGGTGTFRAQMAFPPLASARGQDAMPGPCRPPTTLCGATLKALEQGAFLDFRAGQDTDGAAIRLLSPFDIVRIDPLDRGRCPAKLCAAHTALEGLLGDLLREGYHTQNIALYPGSAMMTLRTERIGRDTKVLKGGCRFNLDTKCVDSNTWLQDDQRSGGPCGFAQTRVFVAATAAPEFVAAVSFAPAGSGPVMGAETLRLAAFDAVTVKIYELVYVHKLCRDEMVLVRNG
jgi:hypothetical protein